MGFADAFRSLDLLEQAAALQTLQGGTTAEAIAELVPLFLAPTGDTAADTMVRNALRSCYLKDEASVVAGLSGSEPAVQAMCLELAGEMALPAAAPDLEAMAQQAENDPERLLSLLTSLARIGANSSLPLLRKHMTNSDDILAAFCLQALGRLKDEQTIPNFVEIIAANEADDRYETCEIPTWKAIEALAAVGSEEAVTKLSDFLHHRNPRARRIVLENLAEIGEPAISLVAPKLQDNDSDTRIMAANVLRDIGHKSSADPLIDALESGAADHPNVGFAVYEALGKTPGVKSLVALTDALPKETESSTLMAIVQALEHLASPAVGAKVHEIVADRMSAQDQQAQRILEAIVHAKAMQLFAMLYEDAVQGRILIGLAHKAPQWVQVAVMKLLKTLQTEQAASDLESLQAKASAKGSNNLPTMLAIDDSVAMRNFYEAHGESMGFAVTVAEHGQEALDFVESASEPFAIVVVDMNMPVMDGIEFTGKLRAMPVYAKTPVLMATTESGRSQAQLARKSGVSSFLPKPFTPQMLQNRLKKMLERSSGA